MNDTTRTRGKPVAVSKGDKYGMLTVIKEVEQSYKTGGAKVRNVLFSCECGVQKIIRLFSVRGGETVSCGCFNKKMTSDAGKRRKTHGQSKTPVYLVWQAMKTRCHNEKDKSYPRYGGRGISVCDEWRSSFEAFANHMGERPDGLTIDRIKSTGNYEPGNVRWATYKEQARNTSRNHMHTINGETKCLAEWCEILNEPWTTVKKRVAAGHDPFTRMRPDRRLYEKQ